MTIQIFIVDKYICLKDIKCSESLFFIKENPKYRYIFSKLMKKFFLEKEIIC